MNESFLIGEYRSEDEEAWLRTWAQVAITSQPPWVCVDEDDQMSTSTAGGRKVLDIVER